MTLNELLNALTTADPFDTEAINALWDAISIAFTEATTPED